MRESNGVPAPVGLSVQLYTWLLAAYPGRFRAEYGYHMAQVFRDTCRRDYDRGGLPGMTSLWARTSLDLARTTVEEHIERGIDMNREKFVRWSGWALVAGAVLFAVGLIIGGFPPDNTITKFDVYYRVGEAVGIVLGQILFVIGLLGLRAGFASRSGGLGAGLLLLAIVGGVVSLAGILTMGFTEDAWSVWMLGLLAMTLALAVFGVVALRRRVFSRWNFAPIVAGIAIPVVLVIGLARVDLSAHFGDTWPSFIAVMLTSAGLGLIGYRMQADGPATSDAAA